jgi:hypothetical protein
MSKSLRLSLTAAVFACLAFFAVAQGLHAFDSLLDTTDQELEGREPFVIASRALRPLPDNEVHFKRVVLETLSDGSSRVQMELDLRPDEYESYSYFIDTDAGTYTTARTPLYYLPRIEERNAQEGAERLTPMTGTIAPPSSSGGCSYRATGVIIHFDPVLIELAITSHSMNWEHDFASNCLSMGSTPRFCWANPSTPVPPPIGPTHWFTLLCNGLQNTIDLQHLLSTAHGRYNNFDFGDPTKETWADHFIQINATTGIATLLMTDNDGGEFSSIIFGVQEASVTTLSCWP